MIWLTWRQHRLEILVLGIFLGLMTAFLIQNGIVVGTAYHRVVQGWSVATCKMQQNPGAICQTLLPNFYQTYEDPNPDVLITLMLPVLVGMFLGAPLVGYELERGTFRLIWAQSVTRLRWLLVKVGTQLTVTLLAFAVISLLLTWYIAQNGVYGGSGWDNFDVVGITPLAYMVFALALGIAAGALLRTIVPAMIMTLIGYPLVRTLIGKLVRPYYVPPYSTGAFDPLVTTPKALPASQDWVTAITWTDHAGHVISNSQIGQICSGLADASTIPSAQNTPDTFYCMHAHGWLQTITWQPIGRVWLFQGIESAVFFGLAAALLVFTYWWIRRRIA